MRLQKVIKDYMWLNHISTRALSKELGIDHTAIHRFISGKNIDSDKVSRILIWLLEDTK